MGVGGGADLTAPSACHQAVPINLTIDLLWEDDDDEEGTIHQVAMAARLTRVQENFILTHDEWTPPVEELCLPASSRLNLALKTLRSPGHSGRFNDHSSIVVT